MKKPPSFLKPRRCLLGSTDSPTKTAIWLFSVSLLNKNHFYRVSWAVTSPRSRGHLKRGHSGAASLARQGPGTHSPVPLPEEAKEGRIVRGKFGIFCKEGRSGRAHPRPRAPGSRPPAHAAPPSGAAARAFLTFLEEVCHHQHPRRRHVRPGQWTRRPRARRSSR